jgi:hypothetical protein
LVRAWILIRSQSSSFLNLRCVYRNERKTAGSFENLLPSFYKRKAH